MKRLIGLMTAGAILGGCAQLSVATNPVKVARVREECRQQVQAATMPPALETQREAAARHSMQQRMFQDCLHERFQF